MATRISRTRLRRSAAFGGVFLASVAVTTAATGALNTTAPVEPAPFKLGESLPKASVTPKLEQTFAAFRKAPTGVPDELKELFGDGGGPTGRNPDLARPIDTLTGRGYIMPAAEGGACVVAPTWHPGKGETGDWGVGCGTARDIATHGAKLGFETEAGDAIETVVVPDGATVEQRSPAGVKRLSPADGVVSVKVGPKDDLVLTTP